MKVYDQELPHLIRRSWETASLVLPHLGLSASAATGVDVTVLILKERQVSSSIAYALQGVSVQGMTGCNDGQVRVRM